WPSSSGWCNCTAVVSSCWRATVVASKPGYGFHPPRTFCNTRPRLLLGVTAYRSCHGLIRTRRQGSLLPSRIRRILTLHRTDLLFVTSHAEEQNNESNRRSGHGSTSPRALRALTFRPACCLRRRKQRFRFPCAIEFGQCGRRQERRSEHRGDSERRC